MLLANLVLDIVPTEKQTNKLLNNIFPKPFYFYIQHKYVYCVLLIK